MRFQQQNGRMQTLRLRRGRVLLSGVEVYTNHVRLAAATIIVSLTEGLIQLKESISE